MLKKTALLVRQGFLCIVVPLIATFWWENRLRSRGRVGSSWSPRCQGSTSVCEANGGRGEDRRQEEQGPTGSCFQLRDGSGSGIGKNFGFGFGYGSGSGISTAFLSIGYYRVLKILIGYFPDKVLSFGSTKVLAALEPLDPSTRLARIYVGFNAILGCCSRRAEQIKEAAQKSDWIFNFLTGVYNKQ